MTMTHDHADQRVVLCCAFCLLTSRSVSYVRHRACLQASFSMTISPSVLCSQTPVGVWLLERLPELAMEGGGEGAAGGAAGGPGGGDDVGGVPGLLLAQLRWWVHTK